MLKITSKTASSSFLKKVEQPCQVGITGTHNLNYTNLDYKFPLEVQQYGRPSPKYGKRNSAIFSF